MIIIAESGSTKCHWILCDKHGEIKKEFKTIGLNPYFTKKNEIINTLKKSEINEFEQTIKTIFFYGAGCLEKEKRKIIKDALQNVFTQAIIKIKHDLEAACLALYKNEPNITCILGTGSNSCYYDGKNITKNSPSLGFIIGDEASGNYFGKKILNLYFNNLLPKDLKSKLKAKYEIDIAIVRNKLYNSSRPNMFLAKYFPFISENKDHPFIYRLIYNILEEFITVHVKSYKNHSSVKINFVGSVAFYLKDEIEFLMKKHKIKLGDIIKDPIYNLVKYHSKNINNY